MSHDEHSASNDLQAALEPRKAAAEADSSGNGRVDVAAEDLPLEWKAAAPREHLLAEAQSLGSQDFDLEDDRHVVVYGLPEGSDGGALRTALAALGGVPELEHLSAIFVVDELGHFIDGQGQASEPIRAMPPDGDGRMLLARPLLAEAELLVAVFEDLAERERMARTGESCQVRQRTSMGRDNLVGDGWDDEESTSPHGNYQGRPIIGRDAQITGGVYLSGGETRPAIVVDHTRDHRLRRLYRHILASVKPAEKSGVLSSLSNRLSRSHVEAGSTERRILRHVHSAVRERLPPWVPEAHEGRTVDEEVMAAIASRGERVRPGQKIYLGEYLRISSAQGQGGGECVHQSLLAAHILERLSEDGVLEGRVSFERNQIQGLGAHAWVRFAAATGIVWVLDAMQDYLGPMEKASNWIYMRSEDIAAMRNRPL